MKAIILIFINAISIILAGRIIAQNSLSTIDNTFQNSGISFTENKGQIADFSGAIRPDILYKSNGGGADIYLRKQGMSYVFSNLKTAMHEVEEELEMMEKRGIVTTTNKAEKKRALMEKESLKIHRVDVDFIGANENSVNVNSEEVEGYSNYYFAHCPKGVEKVRSYKLLTRKSIYPNIDVQYNGNGKNGIKYDIIVQPNGDPNLLKFLWKGADEVSINNEGNLKIRTSVYEFTESIPEVYQIIEGSKIKVHAKYLLKETDDKNGNEAGNNFENVLKENTEYEVSYDIKNYDIRFPLIIDPAVWITYYGGSDFESGSSVTTDDLGNSIFSGNTTSINFPVQAGASQSNLAGTEDAFIVKMAPNGGRVFATYFGGSEDEEADGIDADSKNEIYLTGITNSSNFPTKIWGTAFMQLGFAGVYDSFIGKFSSSGTLIWSTFYGGSGQDNGLDIITNNLDEVTLTGFTASLDFPTQAAYQSSLNGIGDAMVVKFDINGTRQWATYYGGSQLEFGLGITTDNFNNIYICGSTGSADFPILSAAQSTFGGGGLNDGIIFALNPSTGFPNWSTFYGGTSDDLGVAIASDGIGNIFLGMRTSSLTGIATAGAYQTIPKSAALIKFTNSGSLVWGTYLGSLHEEATGLAVDERNNIVIVGDTYSPDLPVTPCAYQTSFKGTEDQFIATFNQQGNLICAGYLGIGDASSPHNETEMAGGSVAVYNGFLFICAITQCNYPVTPGAYQLTCGGGPDAAFSKLCIYTCGLPKIIADFTANTTICQGQSVNYILSNTSCDTAGTTYLWTFEGGNPLLSVDKNPSVTYNTPGNYTVKLMVNTPCGKDSLTKTSYIKVNSCGFKVLGNDTTICAGACVPITAKAIGGQAPYSYSWNTIPSQTKDTINVCPVVTTKYIVTITDKNGDSGKDTITVKVSSPMSLTFKKSDAGCTVKGSAAATVFGGTGPFTFSWDTSPLQNTSVIHGLSAGTYTLSVTDSTNCQASAQVIITEPVPIDLSLSSSQSSCNSSNGTATASTSGGDGLYTYSWNTNPVQTGPNAVNLKAGTYSVLVKDGNDCSKTGSVSISDAGQPKIRITDSTNILCHGGASGKINLTVLSGTGPFSFIWSNGSTSEDLVNLKAGNYSVKVKDKNGCTASTSTTIVEPDSIKILSNVGEIKCNGANTGSIDLIVSGGSSPYVYTWNNGATTEDLSNLSGGSYTVNLYDANNCYYSENFTISEPSALTLSTSATSSSCKNPDGTVTVNASGGVGNSYTFNWNTIPIQTTKTAIGLGAGNYTVTVRDVNKCSKTAIASVSNSGEPTVSVKSFRDIKCNGTATGFITVLTTGKAPISYDWNNGETTDSISNLQAGNYSLTVTDGSGCKASLYKTLNEPPALKVSFSTKDVSCTSKTGSASLVVSGGVNPYQYSWSNGATSSTVSNLLPKKYDVTVTDNNGCSSKKSLSIFNNPRPTVSANPDTICFGEQSILAAQSTSGVSYLWSTGDTTQRITIKPAKAGSYPFWVKAISKGCSSDSAVVELKVNPRPDFSFAERNLMPCFLDGPIILISPLNSGYSKKWQPTGATKDSITVTKDGTYMLTITNQYQCNFSDKVKVINRCEPKLFVPNAFTPNGDGNNDSLAIFYKHIKDFELLIFNRWGEIVYKQKEEIKEKNSSNKGYNTWDGTYLNAPAPFETYPYVIKYNSAIPNDKQLPITKRGSVTILR